MEMETNSSDGRTGFEYLGTLLVFVLFAALLVGSGLLVGAWGDLNAGAAVAAILALLGIFAAVLFLGGRFRSWEAGPSSRWKSGLIWIVSGSIAFALLLALPAIGLDFWVAAFAAFFVMQLVAWAMKLLFTRTDRDDEGRRPGTSAGRSV